MRRCTLCGETTEAAVCPNDGASTLDDAEPDPLIGTTLAERYTLLGRIGSGGMSVVYRARQTATGRDVAVKFLPRERRSLEAVQRFHREMQASARLSHPNCVQVFDFGHTDDGRLYLVMELVGGETLGALLRRERSLEPRRAARIGAQLARAVGAAHALGFVHRDVKPDNVMLTAVVGEPELVKLVDFGIVQAVGEETWQTLTRSGAFAGTPRYAAPEQARGEDVGPASDLYSLGLVLFEMVAGRLPRALDALGGAERLRPAAGPGVPRGLDALVASLLERDPARRPAHAGEVALRLVEISGDTLEPGAARRRRRGALLLLSLAAGCAVSLSAYLHRRDRTVADPLASPPLVSTGARKLVPSVPPPGGCPAGMVLLEKGRFTMGSNDEPSEEPPHPESVAAFCLDLTEVTAGAYQACRQCERPSTLGACTFRVTGKEQHPINCVSWKQAGDYCAAAGKRLPTEAEWEYAARGGKEAETTPRRYPWGSTPAPAGQVCWNGEGNEAGNGKRTGTCPVGSYAAGDGVKGLKDLAGNVGEWTASAFCPYGATGVTECDETWRVIRGGSWGGASAALLRASSRRTGMPVRRDENVGFRCARTPD